MKSKTDLKLNGKDGSKKLVQTGKSATGVKPAGKVNKAAAAKLAMKAGLKKKKKLLASVGDQQQQKSDVQIPPVAKEPKRKRQLLSNEEQPKKLAPGKRPKLADKSAASPAKKKLSKAAPPPAPAAKDAASKAMARAERAAAAAAKDGDRPAGDKPFLSDTGQVKDPIVRAEIQAYIEDRTRCTVRLRPLPNRLRLSQVSDLCPEATAVRVPWNYARGRNKGVGFLEFADQATARQKAKELDGNKTLGCRLGADFREELQTIDADDYNCTRVVVSSLHPLTSGQELKDLVRVAERVDFLSGSKSLRKHTPAVAFLTFVGERDALDAVRKFQGEVIRGRKTSWMFQKRVERLDDKSDRTELVVFGVAKSVTDEQLLAAFPNCQKVDVRQSTGMAVIGYEGEEDCRLDYEACKNGVARVGKARLRVFYGHRNYKPVDVRRREAATKQRQLERQEKLQQEQQHRGKQRKPPKQSSIDPSLFNKSQLIVKDFKPEAAEADFSASADGVQRVFLTDNRRLAFLHFADEAAAAAAKEKLTDQGFQGAKVKVMYAMDKPDKKKGQGAGRAPDGKKKADRGLGGKPDKPKKFGHKERAKATTDAG